MPQSCSLKTARRRRGLGACPALLDHRAERSHAAGAARAFAIYGRTRAPRPPELDDEDRHACRE